MTAFFSIPGRLAALHTAASSWHGTPFFANSCAKGRGVSCQFLAWAIYTEAGVVIASPPEVDMSHAKFSRVSLVEPWVDGQAVFQPIQLEELEPGDLMGFRIGKVVHHVGVMLGRGVFLNVVDGTTVQNSYLSDNTWRSRLARAWRPVE